MPSTSPLHALPLPVDEPEPDAELPAGDEDLDEDDLDAIVDDEDEDLDEGDEEVADE